MHFEPKVFMTLNGEKFLEYKPAGGDLISGTYIPEGANSYLCKYAIPTNTFGYFKVTVEVDNRVFESDNVGIFFSVCPTDLMTAEATSTDETGITGRILHISNTRDLDMGTITYLPGVTLTIISGPRAGQSTVSDRDGYYHFAGEDDLHLLVEKDCYETKEVLVSRHNPTALMPERVVQNYRNNVKNLREERRSPGNIILGWKWPEPARNLLRQVLIPHDLLYAKISMQHQSALGIYAGRIGLIQISDGSWGPAEILKIFSHEIAHAHQHAIVSIDGSGSVFDWKSTPEGLAYEQARQKDWEEFGDNTLYIDTSSFYRENLHESSADILAWYWLHHVIPDDWKRVRDEYTGFNLYEMAKTHAPHRLKWAEEWHEKTKP